MKNKLFSFLHKTSFIFFICSLLVLVGCRTKTVVIHEEYEEDYSKSLNIEEIENFALKDEWVEMRQCLQNIHPKYLNDREKSQVLYWLGVSNFFLGKELQAKDYWQKSLSYEPSIFIKQKIISFGIERKMPEQNRDHVRSSGHDSEMHEQWIVQCGLFSLKRSANSFLQDLKWKRINAHLDLINFQGKSLWLVWLGPFQGEVEAKSVKDKLKKQRIDSVVKEKEQLF